MRAWNERSFPCGHYAEDELRMPRRSGAICCLRMQAILRSPGRGSLPGLEGLSFSCRARLKHFQGRQHSLLAERRHYGVTSGCVRAPRLEGRHPCMREIECWCTPGEGRCLVTPRDAPHARMGRQSTTECDTKRPWAHTPLTSDSSDGAALRWPDRPPCVLQPCQGWEEPHRSAARGGQKKMFHE